MKCQCSGMVGLHQKIVCRGVCNNRRELLDSAMLKEDSCSSSPFQTLMLASILKAASAEYQHYWEKSTVSKETSINFIYHNTLDSIGPHPYIIFHHVRTFLWSLIIIWGIPTTSNSLSFSMELPSKTFITKIGALLLAVNNFATQSHLLEHTNSIWKLQVRVRQCPFCKCPGSSQKDVIQFVFVFKTPGFEKWRSLFVGAFVAMTRTNSCNVLDTTICF